MLRRVSGPGYASPCEGVSSVLTVSASHRQVRQYERAPIRERGTLVVNGSSQTGTISRVGGGGLFFETESKLEKGTTVLVKFRLACFDEPVVVKGEVRWVTAGGGEMPAGLGIAFVDLEPKRRQQIVEFVAERGNVLCEVDDMLDDPEMDLARLKGLLAKVDLDGADSIDEIKKRVKKGLDGFFERD